ncbi:thioesterase family protein [Clostridium estertheticum]|uniref:Thioesterase family protein n=1 Tax=Clostridium estertheticum TaxID=238834 RepID=A0A7Y3SXE6_9CLOT|nr:thioesterase family protein [Clostridium estertheticum]MBU3154431.1 thioesterase family protein [Clostridium estertheticum]MBU3177783.1 thioesterase family protein [Clostridium estertheticum]MBU3202165.1 thioesterase family protein [Clostridium estertheticum]MBU3216262.1 thioesterase family protein [Clostridium estertheticum]MBW9172038.1 thioesterase family protein [Clostridium estertheticum]
MEFNFNEGLKSVIEQIVGKSDTANSYGSGDLDVYATPAMTALMENAAKNGVKKELPVGYTTVGIEISVKHIKPTPVGVKVRAEAILEKAEGKKLTFKVEAFDDMGKIGEGTHIRYVVKAEEFIKKIVR